MKSCFQCQAKFNSCSRAHSVGFAPATLNADFPMVGAVRANPENFIMTSAALLKVLGYHSVC